MTHAEQLRKHAELAMREGGMYYSGEYLSMMAKVAESLEAENVKLRELVADMWQGMCGYFHDCRDCEHYELYEGQRFVGECEYHRRERELGIEVDDA